MDFLELCRSLGAPEIIRRIGCPERTAYSWIMGDKVPRGWVQRLVVRELKRKRPRPARE